ncbi:GntR family transcriptional regulator [Lentzea sp. NBRC 102530]|uniref:GntR family transcriptional regulator n=1 Tax=Lentzea sp. NBRC 102530 TaxID=3032201 RepID=UPI0024A45AE3|nr:GntR family transcriptional regulator [Lentzea sp. NBRC 102530]GLY48340.1 GntR family transcriptional regulator [Lentzea sp. NBRC 102530]
MTGPRIVVDVENGVPPWRQVRDQLVRLIGGGVLPVGSRLPTIRQLAADLGLAAGTVARAYRELEVSGVITTGRRQGTVVAALPPHDPDPLSAAAAEFVAIARSLGASEGEALNAVRAHYLLGE